MITFVVQRITTTMNLLNFIEQFPDEESCKQKYKEFSLNYSQKYQRLHQTIINYEYPTSNNKFPSFEKFYTSVFIIEC